MGVRTGLTGNWQWEGEEGEGRPECRSGREALSSAAYSRITIFSNPPSTVLRRLGISFRLGVGLAKVTAKAKERE